MLNFFKKIPTEKHFHNAPVGIFLPTKYSKMRLLVGKMIFRNQDQSLFP